MHTQHATTQIAAVLFDFGGVITSSPFEAFARLEDQRNLPRNLIRTINAANPDSNAWARFERAEIDARAFDLAFAAEAAAMGHALSGRDVLAVLAGELRPAMVTALDQLRSAGYKLGCITNNVPAGQGAGMAASSARQIEYERIFARFDHVIESSKAGIRKPDPQIYLMMCDALGVPAARCIYLDDLGINCKPAAQLGMRAIKVVSGDQALAELGTMLGMTLG